MVEALLRWRGGARGRTVDFDPAALRAWAGRLGRPIRPLRLAVERELDARGLCVDTRARARTCTSHLKTAPMGEALDGSAGAWEALVMEGLVPPAWGDGAPRFLRRVPRGTDVEPPAAQRTPQGGRALLALAGDPEAAARAEVLLAQAVTACDAWNRAAGGMPFDPAAFAPPLWVHADPWSGGVTGQSCMLVSTLVPLRAAMIAHHPNAYDGLRRWAERFVPPRGFVPGACEAVQLHAWYRLLSGRRRAFERSPHGTAPLEGRLVATLPDPFAPLGSGVIHP